MATLKDVAKLAHVDVSTVSRALNNTSYVHPDTKARILKAVEELSYKPNVLKRGLQQGKRHTIGVVIPKISFSVFAEVLRGINEEAAKEGYVCIVCQTDDDKDIEKEKLNTLRNGFIDGMIIAGTGYNKRLVRDIHASGIAVTQIIRQLDYQMSSVVVNYEEIGYRATQHLYMKGCRRIGLINGTNRVTPYADRYKGYHRAMQELDLDEIVVELDSANRGMQYGHDCAVKMLDENSGLDGIMAATDAQGMGVLRAMKENNIRVPEDLKLISMTGHNVGDMLETSLTSIELPARKIGIQAAKINIQEIETGGKASVQQVRLETVLKERESTRD